MGNILFESQKVFYNIIIYFEVVSIRRKERIADAYTGHDSAVSLIKYGVGLVVSMG